jgi:dGTP triphosphohydrolase
VIEKPELVSVQIGQRHKMADLFKKLMEWVDTAYSERDDHGNRPHTRDEKWIRQRRLPVGLTEHINYLRKANSNEGAYRNPRHNRVRGTIDYIASMTESELDDMYLRLTRGYHLTSVPGGPLD